MAALPVNSGAAFASLPVFTCSAVDAQKLEVWCSYVMTCRIKMLQILLLQQRRATIIVHMRKGVRVGDGAARVFRDVGATELPALRGLLRAAAAAHHTRVARLRRAAFADAEDEDALLAPTADGAAAVAPTSAPFDKTGALVLDAVEARIVPGNIALLIRLERRTVHLRVLLQQSRLSWIYFVDVNVPRARARRHTRRARASPCGTHAAV